MDKTFNIFGYQAIISGIRGIRFLEFIPNHYNTSISIAKRFNIPIMYDKPNWNYLLKKLYPNRVPAEENNCRAYSPVFENDKQVEYFALSLQTEFLINII